MTDKIIGALTQVPEDFNFLDPHNFVFHIRRCPNVVFFLHKINIPGVQAPSVVYQTPFVELTQTADTGKYNNLIVNFRVNENLTNYLEMHSWIRNIAKLTDFQEYASLKQNPEWTGLGLTSEVLLTILDSARQANYTFTFHGAFPISLSDLDFDVMDPEVNYLNATVELDFDFFDYERHK